MAPGDPVSRDRITLAPHLYGLAALQAGDIAAYAGLVTLNGGVKRVQIIMSSYAGKSRS